MGPESSLGIPVINFSGLDLKPGTPVWDSVKSQVWKSAEEYGCFKASFNKIPRELREAMDGALEELFDLPVDSKKRNVSEIPFHGYIGPSPVVPLYESIGIGSPEKYDEVDSLAYVLWPQGNENFSKTIHAFSRPLAELDQIIRRMIVECLGVEKYLDEHMNSTYYALRVAKYEIPEATDKMVGLKAHVDQNVLSILYQNGVDGLEVQSKDGEWMNAKFSSLESFMVIFGESLNAWTNGRLYCPYHRVMMAGDKKRYSAVFCSNSKRGYIIKAPEELVDEEHPLVYKPYDFFEYLKLRSKEVGKTMESPLKSYLAT